MEQNFEPGGSRDYELRSHIEQLRAEDERRSQRSLRLGIMFSTMFITAAVAGYTFYQQGVKEAEVDDLLQREIALQSRDLQERVEESKRIANQVRVDLEQQRELVARLSANSEGNIDQNMKSRLAALDSRVTSLQTKLATIETENVVKKLADIERALEGDVTSLLSVPLLRSKFDSFQEITQKETLKLEKNIEKLESRINFFVTTTVTLIIGIITAVLVPLLSSFLQRRAVHRPSAGNASNN